MEIPISKSIEDTRAAIVDYLIENEGTLSYDLIERDPGVLIFKLSKWDFEPENDLGSVGGFKLRRLSSNQTLLTTQDPPMPTHAEIAFEAEKEARGELGVFAELDGRLNGKIESDYLEAGFPTPGLWQFWRVHDGLSFEELCSSFLERLEALHKRRAEYLASVVAEIVQHAGGNAEKKSTNGPTDKTRIRAEMFKRLKDAHPDWSQGRVAQEASDRLGDPGITESTVKNAYRAMGWIWPERANRIR